MSNLFLAGTAVVDMLDGDQFIGTARTLLDSSITIAVSEQEVRGGQGNALYGKYFHTSKFDAKLTDSMFRFEYLAKNIGSYITVGADVYNTEEIVLGAGGVGAVTNTPVNFDKYGIIGWATKVDNEVWQKVTFTDKNFTFTGGVAGDHVKIKYLNASDSAREIIVDSNIIPSTIRLVMRASLFAGDSSHMETATKVGYAEIEVPRFVLNGNQEIAMTSTGVANTPLTGSALRVDRNDIEDSGYYAMIREIITGAHWYDDVYALSIEAAPIELTVADTEPLKVWALHTNALPSIAPNSDLTFVSDTTGTATVNASGVVTGVAAGTAHVTVTITAKTSIEASVTVDVTA